MSAAAVAALLVLLSLQFGLHLSADRLVGANQTLEIGRGECQSLNLTISGGFGYSILGATPLSIIHLDAVEVPAGVNVSINPSIGSPLFYSNATFLAYDNATEGRKKIVIYGVGPFGETERLEIDLEVVATRSFELIGSTAEITMKQNKTAAIPVQIIRNPDYVQTITFQALSLPAGVLPAFDPSGSQPSASQTRLLLKIAPETRVGTYDFSILGTGADGRTAHCNLSLKIEADRYFTISANPSIIEIARGNDSLSSIELTGINNYTGKIKLSAVKYPKDIISADMDEPMADLSAYSVSDRSNLRLHAGAGAIPGSSYYVVVNALGQDGYSANCSIIVVIEGRNGSFKISPQYNSLQLKPGEINSSKITIEGIDGYEGTITLSVSDVHGITANIDPIAVFINGQKSAASCRLSVHAQGEDDSAAKSDMIISGSDASQNSDDCRIAVSVQNGPFAATQNPVKTQVAEPQTAAVTANAEPSVEPSAAGPAATEPSAITPDDSEPPATESAADQVVSAVNGMPSIESMSPDTDRVYSSQLATFLAVAKDPENDAVYYRFLNSGQIVRDWSAKNTAEIALKTGANDIEVQVIDGLHNGKDKYDDNKIIRIMAYPEIQAASSSENTTSDQFFDEISAKDFNYSRIPIISMSAGTRDRWYRNDPGSANYVGEYEIRKELFYSKSDYTIKLVLDNQSNPIDVIFMQGSNVISEVPSGFVEQAMRKLSSI
ncbi:MAG TPA: hypothetical protein PKV33_05095 [Methanothrix sp.]|nr:hypothetical protein [Methanothrix sp.]